MPRRTTSTVATSAPTPAPAPSRPTLTHEEWAAQTTVALGLENEPGVAAALTTPEMAGTWASLQRMHAAYERGEPVLSNLMAAWKRQEQERRQDRQTRKAERNAPATRNTKAEETASPVAPAH